MGVCFDFPKVKFLNFAVAYVMRYQKAKGFHFIFLFSYKAHQRMSILTTNNRSRVTERIRFHIVIGQDVFDNVVVAFLGGYFSCVDV